MCETQPFLLAFTKLFPFCMHVSSHNNQSNDVACSLHFHWPLRQAACGEPAINYINTQLRTVTLANLLPMMDGGCNMIVHIFLRLDPSCAWWLHFSCTCIAVGVMNVEREGQRYEFCTTIFLPHIMSVQITVMMYQIHILTHTPTPVESVHECEAVTCCCPSIFMFLASVFFMFCT